MHLLLSSCSHLLLAPVPSYNTEMEKYLHGNSIVRRPDILALNREEQEGQRNISQQQHIPPVAQQSAIVVEEVCSSTGSSVATRGIEGGTPPTTTSPPSTANNHHVKYYATTPTTTAMSHPCSLARSNRVDDVISTSRRGGVEVILDAPVTISTPPAPASSYSFSSNLKMEQSCSMLAPAPMVVTPFHDTSTTPTDATNNDVFNHHTVAQNEQEGNPPLEYIFIPSLESTTNSSNTTDSLPSQQDIMNSTVPSSCILPKFSPPYKNTKFSSCMDILSWPHLLIQQQQQVEEEGDHDMNSVTWYHDKQEEHLERMSLEEDPMMTTIDTTWKASNWAMRTSYAFDFDHSSHHGAESLIFSSSEASLEEEDNDEDDYLDGIKYVSSGAYIYY
mmetsp:Transcript_2794/g.5220  ORF Transcript_2794/g.5220 Transcript_2794/m.5220 type:complete len:389 (+) Transcript_2794:4494-5660(+)